MNSRQLRAGEAVVLSVLLRAAGDPWTDIDLSELTVAEMDDGGMGSLTILPPNPERRYGRTLVEGWFTDEDDMPVSVAVFLDQQDRLSNWMCGRSTSHPCATCRHQRPR
jgi:hypothetical protein